MNRPDGGWYVEESGVAEPDMHIYVIDNDTKKIISISKWDYSFSDVVTKRE